MTKYLRDLGRVVNHKWVRLQHGFVNWLAVIGWYTRKLSAWRLSNTTDTPFCVEAIKNYGTPDIFYIPTKGRNSPATPSRGCWLATASPSVRTGVGVRLTTQCVATVADCQI